MAHVHGVYDTDKHFIINPITRALNTESEKLTITQYDHNSERYTFEIPRYVEGHDMSLCNYVRIHFENISKNKQQSNSDFYTVTDLQISPDSDDVVIFSWLISSSATQLVGKLKFSIRFECLSDSGSLDYSWGTTDYEKISVLTALHNAESVITEYSDFAARMEVIMASTVKSVNSIVPDENGNVTINIPSDLPEVTDDNNGAFLQVVNGVWTAVQLSDAEEATF